MTHEPLEHKLKHPPDFQVRYEIQSPEEGGRESSLFYQGYRSDFWYENQYGSPTQLYMIWPEFLDLKGNVILDKSRPLSHKGIANMWIMNPEMRKFHQQNIQIGLRGYLMEALTKVARCEVIKILGLMENPTSR